MFGSACGGASYTPPAPAATTSQQPTVSNGLPVQQLSLSAQGRSVRITAEIAATNEERGVGLMFRQSLGKDVGMLFVYPEDQTSGHWMRNTYIALDIAYIDSSGTVLEVRLGKPLDETVLRPVKPYRFALEMTAGWFAEHGLGADTQIALPKDLPAAK